MKTPENGTHWAVRRDFIGYRLASLAAAEALELIKSTDTAAQQFVSRGSEWDNEGLKVLTVDVAGLIQSLVAENFKSLLHIYKRAGEVVGKRPNFFLNAYEPGGHTGVHCDEQSPETLAIGLVGVAKAHIEDPSSGDWRVFTMKPTDALYLDNSWPEEGRPLHYIENLGMPRIAFVTGSTPPL
jgi:hypothetical protein